MACVDGVQVPDTGPQIAHAIASSYPSLGALIAAFQAPEYAVPHTTSFACDFSHEIKEIASIVWCWKACLYIQAPLHWLVNAHATML